MKTRKKIVRATKRRRKARPRSKWFSLYGGYKVFSLSGKIRMLLRDIVAWWNKRQD